jgi:hypothetical protein
MKNFLNVFLAACFLVAGASASTSWIPRVGVNLCTSTFAPFTIKRIQFNPSALSNGTILVVLNEYPNSTFRYTFKGSSKTEAFQASAMLSVLLTAKATGDNVDFYMPSTVCGAAIKTATYDFTAVKVSR